MRPTGTVASYDAWANETVSVPLLVIATDRWQPVSLEFPPMHKIKNTSVVVLATFTALIARALPLTTEAGLSYAFVSGVRPYSAPELTHSDTSGHAVPYVRVSTTLCQAWRFGVGYCYIGDLKGSGVAPSPNIFHDPGLVSAAVLTPFRSTEDIHELSFDARYCLALGDGFSFQAGPVASLFYSRARIAYRSFSDTRLKLGAIAELRRDLTPSWQLAVGGRYSHPTDRDITHLYVSVGYRF